MPIENRVIVEGINLRTKHLKPTQEGESGRIVTEEASVHASNVMLYSKDKKIASSVSIVVDKDGTKKGFDNKLNHKVSSSVSIPVIASGGAGNIDHLIDGIKLGEVDAVLAASIFHFSEYSIQDTKKEMSSAGIEIRL